MKTSHVAVIVSALAALALQIGGLQHWHDALTPSFVSGAILAVGASVSGLFVQPPGSQPPSNVVPMPRP
jgi:hypothetical protein